MAKKKIAKYVVGSCGYHLYSPDSVRPDLYFSTFEKMREFCYDMGWKLRRG